MNNIKMYKPTLILFFLLISLVGYGQSSSNSPFKVEGQVIDAATSEPISYATITIYTTKDSTLVTGGISDDAGKFSIPVKGGQFWVSIQSIGYNIQSIPNIVVSAETSPIQLGVKKLGVNVKTLTEVVVQGEKSQMELSLDKRVFNVSKDLSNMGGTAADILNNLPSVQVDLEGAVSLRGSSNVQILVDGKPSGLVGMNGNALRQLQGNIIERIEVVTNPSSRYDAEGTGGIINIILKKDKEKGVNGSIDLTAGYPDFHGAAVNLNFRRKKLNFFVNYGLNYRQSPGRGLAEQQFFLEDSTFSTNRVTNRVRGGTSNNVRTGLDYNFNDKNSITAAFVYRTGNQDNEGTIVYKDFNSLNQPINETLRTDLETENDSNLEYDLNYKRTFDQKGRVLTADVQYRLSKDNEGSDFIEEYSNGKQDLAQRSNNDEINRNVLTQVDYIHPFGEKGKIEIGYRGNFREISNDYLIEEEKEGVFQTLENLTNDFIYTENVYAFYFIVGNQINKFSYQLGLRSETTDLQTNLRTTNQVNNKNYSNLFPSAFVTYGLTKQTSLQLSYSRRLRRPGFRELNPFFTFSDARNIRTGNPDIDPSYTDSYEVGYLRNFTKGNVYLGSYYRYTTGDISRISTVDASGTTFTRPVNLGVSNNYGIEINGAYDVSSWWKLNGNFNFFRAVNTGSYLDQNFDFDTYSWWTRFTSRMTFKKKYDFQAAVNYRAPQNEAQGRRLSMYSIDLGLATDVMNKKGTLGVSVRDLLNTQKWRTVNEGPNFASTSEYQWRLRQFLVNFTYRINQKPSKKPSKSREEYGDDEF